MIAVMRATSQLKMIAIQVCTVIHRYDGTSVPTGITEDGHVFYTDPTAGTDP